ncbi:LysR family transcriptional regulator [Variovorax sp. J22G73]|uniref:LysR family transcriptional regulator n=1 Tax=unclassified Variovorax TaxID=663243 RepID=UPI0025763D95|nr:MULTISPECIES: LysR family transcriptional regulator [unclassified Variovorax]MDM0008138.1 LysR family transcriptional regulator [Variovorax sp. J22R203]MDM0100644.1 LysR family transcriptional regulator [Variovorax sp. J22G73]
MKRNGLSELDGVVAVAAHRSFRKAAAELGVSPSALSQSVAGLEAQMGVRLFHRTTRSVALTQAGEDFLDRVRPALRQLAAAMDATNAFRGKPVGTLRINTSEGAARLVLVPVVGEFLRRYPDMAVELVTEGRLVDIVKAGFDAGIRFTENVPQDMIAVACSPPLRHAVVASPAYFEGRSRPAHPDDLAAHSCIRARLAAGALYRWEFERNGEVFEVEVPGALTLDNQTLIVRAAVNGLGIGYVPDWAVADHLASGRLVRVLQDWTPPSPGLSLYYSGHRHVPAGLRAFVDLVRELTPSAR